MLNKNNYNQTLLENLPKNIYCFNDFVDHIKELHNDDEELLQVLNDIYDAWTAVYEHTNSYRALLYNRGIKLDDRLERDFIDRIVPHILSLDERYHVEL